MLRLIQPQESLWENRLRQLGLIEDNGELRVRSALLNIVLHD